MKKKINIMEEGVLRFCFVFLTTLIFHLLFSSSNVFAQEEEGRSRENSSWRDWLGFQVTVAINDVSVSLNLSQPCQKRVFAAPQIGVGVRFGLVCNRQEDDPLTFSVGFAKALNMNEGTKELLEATSLLDIGIEYPIWRLVNKKKHQLRLDLGTFGAMCRIIPPNSKGFRKWGVSVRLALAYDYKLQKDFFVGCKLYQGIGRYFGRTQNASDLQHSSVEELGLAMYVIF